MIYNGTIYSISFHFRLLWLLSDISDMSLRSTNNITENTSFLVRSYETKLLFTDWITLNLRGNGLNPIYCDASSNSVDSKCFDFICPIYTWIILFDLCICCHSLQKWLYQLGQYPYLMVFFFISLWPFVGIDSVCETQKAWKSVLV